jgi:hypothetical protein
MMLNGLICTKLFYEESKSKKVIRVFFYNKFWPANYRYILAKMLLTNIHCLKLSKRLFLKPNKSNHDFSKWTDTFGSN